MGHDTKHDRQRCGISLIRHMMMMMMVVVVVMLVVMMTKMIMMMSAIGESVKAG